MARLQLEYPLARLFIYEQLLDRDRDCAAALIRAAYRFGVVPPGSLDDCTARAGTLECGSMRAARTLIEAVIERSNGSGDTGNGGQVEEIMNALETSLANYKGRCGLDGAGAGDAGNNHCTGLAPAVFDFLLQHLRPYR